MIDKLSLPDGYDWEFSFRKTILNNGLTDAAKVYQGRVESLVEDALRRCGKSDFEYKLFGKPSGGWIDGYYGLDVHYDCEVCILYCSNRGRNSVVAIFPLNNLSAAAEYFVSLVSGGFAKIEWGEKDGLK